MAEEKTQAKTPSPQELLAVEQQAAQAIITLAEAAAKLKESGLLDLLATMAEKYEELLLYTNDQRVFHALALGEAALNGLKQADPWRAKPTVEALTGCIINALDAEALAKAPPVKGVLGLMRALGDPDVAKGLGAMIYLAKRLGACLNKQAQAQG
jgi:uncharacterized protein YjgD (DUF1641 family)